MIQLCHWNILVKIILQDRMIMQQCHGHCRLHFRNIIFGRKVSNNIKELFSLLNCISRSCGCLCLVYGIFQAKKPHARFNHSLSVPLSNQLLSQCHGSNCPALQVIKIPIVQKKHLSRRDICLENS